MLSSRKKLSGFDNSSGEQAVSLNDLIRIVGYVTAGFFVLTFMYSWMGLLTTIQNEIVVLPPQEEGLHLGGGAADQEHKLRVRKKRSVEAPKQVPLSNATRLPFVDISKHIKKKKLPEGDAVGAATVVEGGASRASDTDTTSNSVLKGENSSKTSGKEGAVRSQAMATNTETEKNELEAKAVPPRLSKPVVQKANSTSNPVEEAQS